MAVIIDKTSKNKDVFKAIMLNIRKTFPNATLNKHKGKYRIVNSEKVNVKRCGIFWLYKKWQHELYFSIDFRTAQVVNNVEYFELDVWSNGMHVKHISDILQISELPKEVTVNYFSTPQVKYVDFDNIPHEPSMM